MKKTTAAIAASAAALLFLSACEIDETNETRSSSQGYTPEVEYVSPASSTAPAPPLRTEEEMKVDRMQVLLNRSTSEYVSRDFMTDFARVTCEGLDNGLTLEEQVFMSLDYDFGLSQETMGSVFYAAIHTHCPEYMGQVQAFMNKY
jgi:hypothetical protein